MAAVLAVIALGLMGGTLQARWHQQPPPAAPGQTPDPWQIDTPHSRDILDQDATACPGGGGPPCASNIVSEPRGGVSARTLTHKHSKAAGKALKQGVRAWNKGQNDQALHYFSEAARLDPDSVEALTDLGAAYAKTGRAVEALEQYERALALEPNVAAVHSNKAAALVMLSRWEEAEQAARRAVQLDPESIDANYMLGIALMKQGKITPETAARLAVAAKKNPRARAFLAEVQAYLAAESTR